MTTEGEQIRESIGAAQERVLAAYVGAVMFVLRRAAHGDEEAEALAQEIHAAELAARTERIAAAAFIADATSAGTISTTE